MLALIIIGSILLVLFLLALVPIRLHLEYNNSNISVKIKYLFLTYKVSEKNSGVSKKAQKKDEIKKEKTEEPESFRDRIKRVIKNEGGIFGFFQIITDIIRVVKKSSRKINSHLIIKKFDLYVCVGKEDAAEAAIYYGQASTAVYSITATFFSLLNCKKKCVSVDLNYNSPENLVKFQLIASIPLIFLIIQGIILVKRSLPHINKFK